MYQGQLAFDSCANSGMVFEAAQLIDLKSSPVLALFFSDVSFSGQHMTHHPTYCKLKLFVLLSLLWLFVLSKSSQFTWGRAEQASSLDSCRLDPQLYWRQSQGLATNPRVWVYASPKNAIVPPVLD
jgi:hypothetical protein